MGEPMGLTNSSETSLILSQAFQPKGIKMEWNCRSDGNNHLKYVIGGHGASGVRRTSDNTFMRNAPVYVRIPEEICTEQREKACF